MKLTEILSPACIDSRLAATTRQGAISDLIDLLSAHRALHDAEQAREAVLDREKTCNSAIGHGVALPHGRAPDCQRMVMAVGRLETPVDFGAHDGLPVRLIFLLISPLEKATLHVQTLSRLIQLIAHEDSRRHLENAPNAQAMYDLLADVRVSRNFYNMVL